MSGHSDSSQCPQCGEEMDVYTDWKPFDQVSGMCLHCGFQYYTSTNQLSLVELNEQREEHDMDPLLYLPEAAGTCDYLDCIPENIEELKNKQDFDL